MTILCQEDKNSRKSLPGNLRSMFRDSLGLRFLSKPFHNDTVR